MGEKKKSAVQFPRVREGENTILLLCLSQSHIRSDHWRIKAHPDTSLPLSGGSWHALGTRNDSGGGAQDEEVKVFFWQSEREKGKEGENKGEPDILAAQIHRAKWDEEEEEEEEEAEWQETKRWRGTKNSITGLALTLTFIWQSDTLSVVSSAVTGEACPTFKAQINKSRCWFSNKETFGFNS